MASRVVGVLGGMGPEATIDFLTKVVRATPASKDQDHIRMIIDHHPQVPNRQLAILAGAADPSPYLAEMGRNLQAAGADFLVMPCNAAHAFIDELIAAVEIPFVSIVDASVEAAKVLGVKRVGILATDGCIASGIYQEAVSGLGCEPVQLDEAQTAALMRQITAVKAGNKTAEVSSGIRAAANELIEKKAECVIAACTEIPLVLKAEDLRCPLISSTEVLALKTVEIALRE